MKIVSWNCNGAFRRKFHYLEQLNADILIIQECEDPAQSKDTTYLDWARNYIWIGNTKNKGLGVFVKESATIENLELNQSFGNTKLKWFIPFRYNKKIEIIAVWTQGTVRGDFRYIGQLYQLLLNNSNEINSQVFIGDFNSNKIWDYKRSEGDHSSCVRLLQTKDIVSLYHELMHENQGEETQPTFFLHRNLSKPYHIDYAFLPKKLIDGATLSIGKSQEWLALSDHMPLMINIV